MTGLETQAKNEKTAAIAGKPKLSALTQPTKKQERASSKLRVEKSQKRNKHIEKLNAEYKAKAISEAAPRSTAQVIKYRRMYEDGICEITENTFSKTIAIGDINYQTARRSDQIAIFEKYCEVLNYFDEGTHCQLSIINRSVDGDTFRAQMFLKQVGDVLDEYRKEMNGMLSEKALEGQNSIMRDKYVTFTIKAESYELARPALSRIEADLVAEFGNLGCTATPLSGAERVALLFAMFRPNDRFNFKYSDLIASGLNTKACVAPMSFDFTPKDYYSFGDHYAQTLVLRDLPADLSDELVSELSDIPINMTITLHIDAVEQGKALEYVRTQIALMEMEITGISDKAAQKGRALEFSIPMETKRSYEEAKTLLEELTVNNQRMFKVTVLVYTFAETEEELHDHIEQIMSTARKKTCNFGKLEFLQQDAMNSIIPVGKNLIDVKRTLTTASTAIFIPFTTQELFQPGGSYYGLNAVSHNLIFYDRKTSDVGSGMILGMPGSGKSFSAKREMISVLLSDPRSEVIIIDPEREYTMLSEGFNGEVVHISAGSHNYINPLDITMDYSDQDDPLLLKSEFVLSLCDLILGGKSGLDAAQQTIISRACQISYKKYFQNPAAENMPTLKTFYDILKKQPEPEAQSLALSLEIYVTGTLRVFSNKTNVNTKKRLVVYDVKDLGKQLRTMGMLIVLDQIWNRITQNRAGGIRTWVYIDEMQLLFSNEYSANYFFELWSRARKWGAIPTGITQNVETLLMSDTARRMLSNSGFIMMLNQATNDRQELASLLKISEKQLNYITNKGAGQGLLFAGNAIVPFIDSFPKDTKLYKMMTTKPDEVVCNREEQ